jgi:hypothetical protein
MRVTMARLLRPLFCAALIAGCTPSDPAASDDASTSGATSTTSTTSASSTTPASAATPTDSTATDSTATTPDTGIGDAECDIWKQDCPAGLKCMAYAEPGESVFSGDRCTPLDASPAFAGEPCIADGGWETGIDNCDRGLVCWDIDPETDAGTCVPLCTGSPDAPNCPAAGETCVFWVPGISHVCLPLCDPLLQDCPNAGLCLPNFANQARDWVCARDYSGDQGQEFDPCEFFNVCDPGLMCWDPSTAPECDANAVGCCLAICDLAKPGCTGAGAECLPFYEASAPPEHVDVGICGVP